ncbi:RHS-family protein [Streptococcus anginosus 1_2_62CV]|uniref:HNH endonuclease n=1 Tax=Streptococcus anginosus TaxID=1328 RepID=UPI0001F60400|nr:HNH endonuclease [Streptococcus anginosus]EFW08198.1 RHS-family protein [Streptococcus anginosus 1_2_62CV]
MTKDVELHSSIWKTMKQAITGLTENATVSSSGYGNYTNAQAGSYSTGTASTGFAKRVEDLVKISEKVQKLIKEKDTDGVVSYSYHDDTSTAQTLQSKLSTLERYAGNVPTYIKDKIDRPFYEAMDKVGAKLEALNIQQYKTTNKVGYKRIESVTDPYGHPVGTKEVVPAEIGIDELYKVDSPYRTALQKSYEEFKKSKDYKDHRLTETEYVQAMHQTRAFEYVSIDDEKSKIEMWRDIALGVGLVVLTIFCPPAGAVAGVALAGAEMYSAATGKDWGTGRKLDATERTLRGTFALFDLIPAGKYLGTLAKTGKTAGLTAVKNSLKTTLKEGLEQGVRNLDSFKGILKNAKGLGDNVYHSLSTYRKQITHQLKNSVDEKVLNLSKATQEGLERAKQFTLEVPTVRVVQEASTGSQMMRFEKMSKSLGDTGLGKSLDNLVSKAKHVENTRLDRLRARNAFYGNKVDDVVEAGKGVANDVLKISENNITKEIIETKPKNSPLAKKWLDKGGTIEIDSSKIPPEWIYTDWEGNTIKYTDGFPDFKNGIPPQVKKEVVLENGFEGRIKDFSKAGDAGLGNTWHHHQDGKTLQAVDSAIHRRFTHRGGISILKLGGK